MARSWSVGIVSRIRTLPTRCTASIRQEAFQNIDFPKSAYVHLPFCKRRCHYCDFPIQALGSKPSNAIQNTISEYVQVLCKEIEQTPRCNKEDLETVFFGGGTPSLIPPKDLERILDTLQSRFGFSKTIEISLEADPGTFDVLRLSDYIHLGVNRISLGVQSFEDRFLQLCGRSHNADDVFKAIRDIQSINVPWSLDLISGLPHLTLDSWKATVERAIQCQPNHISIYDLQIEPKTIFGRKYDPEQPPLPSQEDAAEMYASASMLLQKEGFEHYEISNYAKPGYRCRHNMTYWKNLPFYGFGLGATSFLENVRIARPKTMKRYHEWVREQPSEREENEKECELDEMLDTLMLQFRLRDGIHFDAFSKRYGSESVARLQKALVPFCEQRLVECVVENDEVSWSGSWKDVESVRLSDPEGFLLSNEILSTLFTTL